MSGWRSNRAAWGPVVLLLTICLSALYCAANLIQVGRVIESASGMVVAAHRDAAEAGAKILQAGGNAIDAAVAAAFVLAVVEPEASGLGGGGFLLYYDVDRAQSLALNYRETAPESATPGMYSLDGTGSPGHWDAPEDADAQTSLRKHGGGAIAVPRMVAGLLHAHGQCGRVPLASVLEPAIGLAENGFEVSENLYRCVLDAYDVILSDEAMAEAFLNDWLPFEPGEMMCRPDLARTFRTLASEGADAFYRGDMASKIVRAIEEAGGIITREDLSGVSVAMEPALTSTYRGWALTGLTPPAGATQIFETLNVLEAVSLSEMTPGGSEAIHWIAEAIKLSFADRRAYLGDPTCGAFAWDRLLSKDWTSARFAQIDPEGAVLDPSPHVPNGGSTTHISVIDADGNMVSLTQSISYFFGSRVFVPEVGIVMNNTMADFDPEPGGPNSIAPGKIPMSSMSPMLMSDGDRVHCILGTPGGTRIISTMVQLLVDLIDWGVSLDMAMDRARFHTEGADLYVESRIPEPVLESLRALGHPITARSAFDLYFGGAQAIWTVGTGDSARHLGVSDPRRAGQAAGY